MNTDSSKGFTLIELIIVIAIIGIIAAISAFGWQRYVYNTNLRTAARELVSDFALMKARATSVSQNEQDKEYYIVFNVAGNSYTMEEWADGTRTWLQTKLLSDHPKVRLTGGANKVEFKARGTLDPEEGKLYLEGKHLKATIEFTMTGKTYVTFGK